MKYKIRNRKSKTRSNRSSLRESPGLSLASQHPEKIFWIKLTFSTPSCLEGGDREPTLPIVVVGNRPMEGEKKAQNRDQGPYNAIYCGQGPLDRSILQFKGAGYFHSAGQSKEG